MLHLKFFLSIIMIFSTTTSAFAASSQAFFGRAQSIIEEFQDAPLISANWEGNFRPYLYLHDTFHPLLSSEQSALYATTDFYHPKPISPNHFLLYGEEMGKFSDTLFIFDAVAKKLQKIPTHMDGTSSWYSDMCVSKDNALLSYPRQTTQAFYKLNLESLTLTTLTSSTPIPKFKKCMWVNEKQLLGMTKSAQNHQLFKCDLRNNNLTCIESKALTPFFEVTNFFSNKQGVGFIGIKANEMFRKAHLLSANFSSAREFKMPDKLMGDVLEIQEEHFRVGLHSRYITDLTRNPSPNTIITRFKKINGKWYAIAADAHHERTLAVLENDAWRMLTFNPMPPVSTMQIPQEIWTASAAGERYQSFYYGTPNTTKFVIWLHGGPHENFSPRFHSYVYRLNQLGYGVLTVNYPGSTGRGLPYEQKLDQQSHLDCIQSLFQYLKQRNAQQVIVWSISYAAKLQYDILKNNLPVSAVVDQVSHATAADALQKIAADKQIPYFSIRGKHDKSSAAYPADFMFEHGGHDIIYYHDFDLLFDKITPFLAQAKPWTY